MLRLMLRLILIGALGVSAWNLFQISQNPAVAALTSKTGAELTAALNREMVKSATPERVNTRLTELLAQDPVPWLAIQAVQDVAKDRDVTIAPDVSASLKSKYDADHGLLQTSGKCISCGWDAANCELSAILLCRAPVDLTPIGDISGVIRESGNYVLGYEVDKIDLTLSAVGLSATIIAPATGGSSLAVKLGASTIKTTKKLGNLSPGMAKILTKSADEAIDWKKLSNANPLDFPDALKRAIDTDALKPVTATLSAAGDIRTNTGVIETLHLMKYLESAEDAAQTARISKVMGPRTVSAFELVGRSRLLRATLRHTDEVIATVISIVSAFVSALGLLFSSVLTRASRTALKHAH